MKTPREIILNRHQVAEEKLKSISAQDLAAHAQTSTTKKSDSSNQGAFGGLVEKFWHEAIWPWRRAWGGFAAVWIVIVTLHFASSDAPASTTSEAVRPNAEVVTVLQQQRQLLAQLLGPVSSPTVTQPKPAPRSESRHEFFTAEAPSAMA